MKNTKSFEENLKDFRREYFRDPNGWELMVIWFMSGKRHGD